MAPPPRSCWPPWAPWRGSNGASGWRPPRAGRPAHRAPDLPTAPAGLGAACRLHGQDASIAAWPRLRSADVEPTTEVSIGTPSLEDVFIHLTEGAAMSATELPTNCRAGRGQQGQVFGAVLRRDLYVTWRELPVFLAQVVLQPLFLLFVFGRCWPISASPSPATPRCCSPASWP